MFASKKDGKVRFYVDYRIPNAMTVRGTYSLPWIDGGIHSLRDAFIFSFTYCNGGCWKVEITETDCDKTTFSSHHVLFHFIRMPFGLMNAPASLRRAVENVLSEAQCQSALNYLDNIIVYSKSVMDQRVHLSAILALSENAGITLEPSKCSFFDSAMSYAEHEI